MIHTSDAFARTGTTPPNSETVPSARTAREPIPRLHLFSGEVTLHRCEGFSERFDTEQVPLLKLTFDYDGEIVSADESEECDTPRDFAAERRAKRVLESFGATDLSCMDDVAADADADYAVAIGGNVHDFCSFQSHILPQLKRIGFEITEDASHAFRTVDAEPPWYADVDAETNKDWFTLEMGIELQGKRLSLLPALLDLLDRSASGEGLEDLVRPGARTIAVEVGERLYLPIPAAKMRTILRVLAELYQGERFGQDKIKFPKGRAGAIDRLERTLTQDGAELTLTGAPASRGSSRAVETEEEVFSLETLAKSALKATLRPYQEDGVKWLQSLRYDEVGGILADDMGLGKTLQTIAHISLEKQAGRLDLPALIVAPTSLVQNWQREIEKFAPSLRVTALQGSNRHENYDRIEGADVVVTTYPVVIRDEERFANLTFHLLILDEAQTIKNDKSQAHRVVRTLKARHRLCLTGTPVENHLGELWAISDFLNPGLLGDEVHFTRFFRVPIEKQKNNERLAALREILSPYIIRRTKADVAKDLPPKTELFRPIELRGSQRELYETIRVAAHAEVRKLIKKKGLAASTVPILGALTKLRQVCNDPRLVPLSDSAKKRTTPRSAKLDFFDNLLRERLAGGQRVLVFSQFTSMLALIAERLRAEGIRYTCLTGNTEDRRAVVDEFESGKVDVFLISLRAGGTGLTLTSADTVIHFDPWWNPAVQAQATDRAYRIGQTKPVFVHHLYVAGSVEERMLRLQKQKKRMADAILGEGGVDTALSEDDLEVLLAPLGA
ncbi:MAG: DEAD/DEAH box helicase [Polyangiaceae bacterium]